MKSRLGLAARIFLILACLGYVAWGVDPDHLLLVFRSYDPLLFGLVLVGSGAVLLLPGLRLSFLTGGQARYRTALAAFTLGVGLNNMLPARLGELAKAAHLRSAAGVSLPKALSAVFWERLFDVSALLALGIVAGTLMGNPAVILPLAGLVVGLWAFVALHGMAPGVTGLLVRLVPGARLRDFAGQTLEHLGAGLRPGYLLALALYTAATWAVFTGPFLAVVWLVAGLDLGPGQALMVFAVSTMGLAVPSSPGALGVYEAAVVTAMGWAGIGKEEALAAGIALRLVQYLPPTLLALGVMSGTGFSLRGLRAPDAASPEGDEAG